jgi:uncharacterized protein YjlB
MAVLEDAKKIAEKITGWSRPSDDDLAQVVLDRKAHTFRFKDDGIVPNHPKWPLVVYRGAVRFPKAFDPAAVLEDLFESNGWGDAWRDGIYDYVHYLPASRSRSAGRGKVQFSGRRGRSLVVKAGDVASCQPARAINAFRQQGFPCDRRVSSAPANGPTTSYERAVKSIPKVGRPRKDPVYGIGGSLLRTWKSAR